MQLASRGEQGISTHALHEEGDDGFQQIQPHLVISTHALHEEGDMSANKST